MKIKGISVKVIAYEGTESYKKLEAIVKRNKIIHVNNKSNNYLIIPEKKIVKAIKELKDNDFNIYDIDYSL